MAITNLKSVQLANLDLLPQTKNDASEASGKVRHERFTFTQAGLGDIGSTIELIKLPPGRISVVLDLCRLAYSAWGAARTLSIGNRAYFGLDGVSVAEAAASLKSAIDVSAAANSTLIPATSTDPILTFVSRGGVTIFGTLAGGTIPDLATLKGYLTYVKD